MCSDRKNLGKRVAIVQPCYIPWKGYFDLIAGCDEFVLFDDVQYVKRTWFNRNCIKTARGLKWLSIPVKQSGRYYQKICETEISEAWADRHFALIRESYKSAPFFSFYAAELQSLYEEAAACTTLDEVDHLFITYICAKLGIATPISSASTFSVDGKATDRLLELCRKRGATEYLSGPSAKAYFETEKFAAAGIRVLWADYSGYPEYPQLHGSFEHAVSALDLLLNTGPSARNFLKTPRATVHGTADG